MQSGYRVSMLIRPKQQKSQSQAHADRVKKKKKKKWWKSEKLKRPKKYQNQGSI
jgi:hypothetical protein